MIANKWHSAITYYSKTLTFGKFLYIFHFVCAYISPTFFLFHQLAKFHHKRNVNTGMDECCVVFLFEENLKCWFWFFKKIGGF
jgi:hypothetical protein